MPREHGDLITEAKNCPDIESALENTFTKLAVRCREVAQRSDVNKGLAMGNQLTEDVNALVDAILDHGQVFKPAPVVVEPRSARFSGTPKTAVRKYDRFGNPLEAADDDDGSDPRDLAARQAAWDKLTPQERIARGETVRPTATAQDPTLGSRQAAWDKMTPQDRAAQGQPARPTV